MISVDDRGSICSGRTYFPTYFDPVHAPKHPEIFNHLKNNSTIDINSLSSLMGDLTITRRLEKEPEEISRKYGPPTPHAIRKLIRFPYINVEEYENGT
jgi:hypothetical protein